MNYSGKIYDSIGPLITNERGCGAILSSPCTLKAVECFAAKEPMTVVVHFHPSAGFSLFDVLCRKLAELDGSPCTPDELGARLHGRFLIIEGVHAEDKAAHRPTR